MAYLSKTQYENQRRKEYLEKVEAEKAAKNKELGLSSCEEVIDGKVCGNSYDAEKYECCYKCHVRKYADRHGVTATKAKYF